MFWLKFAVDVFMPLRLTCVCDTVFTLAERNPSPSGTGITCRVCSYHVLLTAALPWEYCRAGPLDQFVFSFCRGRGEIPLIKTYVLPQEKLGAVLGSGCALSST